MGCRLLPVGNIRIWREERKGGSDKPKPTVVRKGSNEKRMIRPNGEREMGLERPVYAR